MPPTIGYPENTAISEATRGGVTSKPTQIGPYRLLHRIGQGGMGEVYEGRLSSEGTASKPVAIKLLFPHLCHDTHAVQCFIDEASIASQLHHPNIVSVHDFGQIDEQYYLAMDLIDGWDSRELLLRCADRSLSLPVQAAAFIVREVAVALHYLHQHELAVIHRDVSPHNIFVGRDGHVLLSDFGVARASQRRAHTATGHVKGKLAYMAPEQVRGEPVTARADVFAAALVLYELITGERFFGNGSDPEIIAAMCNPTYHSIGANFPEAASLDSVLERALQSHPARRTRDAETLAEQLDDFLKSSAFGARDLAAFVNQITDDEEETVQFGSRAAIMPDPSTLDQQATRIVARAGPEDRTTVLPCDDQRTDPDAAPLDAVPTLTLPPILAASTDAPSTVQQPAEDQYEEPAWRDVPALLWTRMRGVFARWTYWPQTIGIALLVVGVIIIVAVGSTGSIDTRTNSPARLPGVPDISVRPRPTQSAPIQSAALDAAPGDKGSGITVVTLKPPEPPPEKRPHRSSRKRPSRKGAQRNKREATQGARPIPTGDPVMERAPTTPRIASVRPKEYLRKFKSLLKLARRRGLGPGDDRRFDRLRSAALAAISQGSRQDDALQMLAERISNVRIDRTFVRRKMARLRKAISRAKRAAQSTKVERLQATERQAQARQQQGDLQGASRLISQALFVSE